MSITDVRVQVPPRAPKETSERMSPFCQSSVARTEKTGLFMLFSPEMTVLSVLLSIVAYLSGLLSVWSAGGQRKTAAGVSALLSAIYPYYVPVACVSPGIFVRRVLVWTVSLELGTEGTKIRTMGFYLQKWTC